MNVNENQDGCKHQLQPPLTLVSHENTNNLYNNNGYLSLVIMTSSCNSARIPPNSNITEHIKNQKDKLQIAGYISVATVCNQFVLDIAKNKKQTNKQKQTLNEDRYFILMCSY